MEYKDLKEYAEKFYQSRLTTGEFIGILLPYLLKNGVSEIYEKELAKKLYAYYIDPKYRKVFEDISKNRDEDIVDIAEAIYNEQYFYRNLFSFSNNVKRLFFSYGRNYDVSCLEKKIDKDIIKLVHEIADHLSLRYKIESTSPHKLNIYSFDPNKDYTVVSGNRYTHNYGWELITDGKVERQKNIPYYDDYFFDDPTDNVYLMSFNEYIAKNVKLKGASYAIMQGTYDEKANKNTNREIRKIEVYTSILDLEKLKKISEYANQIHENNDFLFIKRHSLIKRHPIK